MAINSLTLKMHRTISERRGSAALGIPKFNSGGLSLTGHFTDVRGNACGFCTLKCRSQLVNCNGYGVFG
jgi:hypothetical protein